MSDDAKFQEWRTLSNKSSSWVSEGLERAKHLRKTGSADEALEYLNEIAAFDANNRKALNQILWCKYKLTIKDSRLKDGYKPIVQAALWITSRCEGDLKYTPYIHTCLRLADLALKAEEGTLDDCDYWLSKINEDDLSDDVLTYEDSSGNSQYWSQRRQYLHLKTLMKLRAGQCLEGLRLALALDHTCQNSPLQHQALIRQISSAANCAFRNTAPENEGRKNPENPDGVLLDILLRIRGFLENNIKERYKEELTNKHKLYSRWNKRSNSPVWVPDYATITYLLVKEMYRQMVVVSCPVTSKPSISATDLASFAFCPASYSIQRSFEVSPTEIGNIGKELHDKKVLISKKLEQTKTGFFRIVSNQCRPSSSALGVSDAVWSNISDLMDEVLLSKVIFHGHGTDEKRTITDSSRNYNGAPDYIFRKKNGRNFVVEEKYSLQDSNSRWITRPYDNHLAQLAVYICFLDSIKAEYGYLLYWTFSMKDDGPPYVRSAQAFKITPTNQLTTWALRLSDEIRLLERNNQLDFDNKKLSARKCVNCVYSELCNHKTGVYNSVKFPYTTSVRPTFDMKGK